MAEDLTKNRVPIYTLRTLEKAAHVLVRRKNKDGSQYEYSTAISNLRFIDNNTQWNYQDVLIVLEVSRPPRLKLGSYRGAL